MIFPLKRCWSLLRGLSLFAVAAGTCGIALAQADSGASAPGRPAGGGSIASAADEWRKVVIGFVGESRYEPRTVAALAGARDAAEQLGPKLRMHVSVLNRSPDSVSGKAQNTVLSELFVDGVQGAVIHPVAPAESADLLALLTRQRMPIVTFSSPVAVEGISGSVVDDEQAIGEVLAAEAFRLLDANPRGRSNGIAILAGPKDTAPYSVRKEAAVKAVMGSPAYSLYGTYESEPNFSSALQTLTAVTGAERNERIAAWVSVGGWPLEGYHGQLPRRGGLVGFVVAEGLPSMLPSLERGQVASLVSPDYYRLGYEAMRLILQAQPAETRQASTPVASAPAVDVSERVSVALDTPPAVSSVAIDTPSVSSAAIDASGGALMAVASPAATSAAEAEANPAQGSPAEVSATEALVKAPPLVLVPPRVIRRENLAEYSAQWGKWLGQPM